ncbi:MAG: hypothetical protein MI864_09340 [Pseudomonadales bacterium]|nr:hypothetical protein [Pseudomonadales bacterium]
MRLSTRGLTLFILSIIFTGQLQANNNPTVSPVVYRLLQDAQLPLVGNDEISSKSGESVSPKEKTERSALALSQLSELKLSSYEAALVNRLQGNLAISIPETPDYEKAFGYFHRAWQTQALPDDAQQKLTHLLAQLAFELERWSKAIDYMETWLARMENGARKKSTVIKPEDYLVLAQSYSQLNQWSAVIPPLQSALEMRSPAPESWYQLELAAFTQMEQHANSLNVLKTLVTHYPSSEYWQQLAVTQQQLGQTKAALATLQTAYLGDYIKDEQHIQWLAQLCLEHNLPNKAARVLQDSFQSKGLAKSKTNLTLLANAQISAKSYAGAQETMATLAELFPGDKETLAVLEQLKQFNTQRDRLQR